VGEKGESGEQNEEKTKADPSPRQQKALTGIRDDRRGFVSFGMRALLFRSGRRALFVSFGVTRGFVHVGMTAGVCADWYDGLALVFGFGRDRCYVYLMSKAYCVYILANRSRNLYVGVTGDLERRMVEHRDGLVAGFTTRYRVFRLVHFEVFGDVSAAIAREKEIKGWRREKKIRLVERENASWADLARLLRTIYGAAGQRSEGVGEGEEKATADPSPH
jgi:putative endonuclease